MHSTMFLPSLAFESHQAQDTYQSTALQQTLRYLNAKSPFYKNVFSSNGINVSHISSIKDLIHLPTTSKSDLQLNNMSFLCAEQIKVKEYTATSGTLGQPVTIALTKNDLHRLAYNEQQSFTCAGAQAGDVYQLMLTLDRQFMAGMAYYLGLQQLEVSVIRSGPGMPQIQFHTIDRLQSNSVVTVPSFLVKLIAYAQQEKIELSKLPVKKAVCIGESIRMPNFEYNALGSAILAAWPIQLYSTYAATEIQTAFTECELGKGGHHQPDLIIIEILNDLGEQLSEGEYGELTITTLGIEGMPLLRYRTGDICAYYSSPCPCGRKSKRIGPIVGRLQQMLKYKGTTLYPPALFEILNKIPFISEYVVEAYSGQYNTDEIRLHINTPLPVDDCEQRLKPLLQAGLRVIPELQFHTLLVLQQMQFPEGSRKQVKFIDNRVQQ